MRDYLAIIFAIGMTAAMILIVSEMVIPPEYLDNKDVSDNNNQSKNISKRGLTLEEETRKKLQEEYWQMIDANNEKKSAPEKGKVRSLVEMNSAGNRPLQVPAPSPDKEYVFSWVNEKGIRQFSNTNYPETNETLKITTQTSTPTVTHFTYKNGAIIVPVTINHNGRTVTARFLFDTGASETLFHHTLTDRIRPTITGATRSIVADGRTVKGKRCVVDSFQVGPHTVRNYRAHTYYVQGRHDHEGLLGMDFFEKKNIRIDMQRKVIQWL
jgi:hypothetical protein